MPPPPLLGVSEAQRRRHRRRNLLQSLLLLVGMGVLLVVCALLLLGPTASVWAGIGWLIAVLLGPRVEPAAALSMLGAQFLPRDSFPRGYEIVDRLAERAALPRSPDLYYLPSRQLNAFTVGRGGTAAIAVTGGLLQHLNTREFAAVMAHEIGHIVNNDLWVMNLADTLSRLTRALGFTGVLLLFFGLPFLITGAAGFSWLLGALLLAFAGIPGIAHLAFLLWGIAFGPLVTMYQAAVARQVDRGRDVATSLQSSVFNFSIMLAAGMGGVLLVQLADTGVRGIVWMALGCFVLAAMVALGARQTLRRA